MHECESCGGLGWIDVSDDGETWDEILCTDCDGQGEIPDASDADADATSVKVRRDARA